MIDVAIDAAKQAGALAYQYFGKIKNLRYKGNNSPVTIADIEAEKLIRKIITKNFPSHGIIGEELENVNPKAKYQWVIDPIDGTRNYVRQIPYWTTLLSVLKNNKPIIGVCYCPCQNELFTAQKNKGSFLNGKRTKVSNVKNLPDAYISYNNLKHFINKNKQNNLLNLSRQAYQTMNCSAFGINYLLKGYVETYISAKGSIWDFAAPSILTIEAGGKFSDFDGNYSLNAGNAVFSNGVLHNQILKILNE